MAGWEKDLTLDVALRLSRLLAARDWQVFLTRTNDQDVPLLDRVALAEQQHADFFLSLHFNSAGGNGNGTEQTGLETYCLTPMGMASTLTRGYPDDPGLQLPGNLSDDTNVQFAMHLHRAVLRATDLADRGVRRARFMTVLQGQRCPAVLIEGGYLSNPKEAQRIANWQFRQRLAEAIAEALK
jgi:N-acetylmuramoyl-L-alanine amidase